MSLVKVSGNASGTGTLTIAAPNTNSDYTLTLPQATTTFVGTDATQTLTNKTLTTPTLTTPNIDSAQIPTVSGTAPLYMARAWINFDGTGTPAIRESGNVTSITDNGVGDYTVNFTNAMPDINYSFNGATRWVAGDEGCVVLYNTTTTLTTSAIRIIVGIPGTAGSSALTPADRASVFVQIFR